MPRLNQNFVRFRGDIFTIAFDILDAENIEGYKAEWTVYTKTLDGAVATITRFLTITTDSGFTNPGVGYFIEDGITIDGNQILVAVPSVVYDSSRLGNSSHEIIFEHQLRIWDGDDNMAVAAHGTWDLRKPSSPLTF